MADDAAHPHGPLARLEDADAALATGEPSWRSLDPARRRAHALRDIGRAILGERSDPSARAWADGVVAIATAVRDAFPDNLLWDLDALAAALWREPGALKRRVDELVALQHAFGRRTPIAFSYVHDFLYGFDWAKWCSRSPASRAGLPPYSPELVAAMHRRARELRAAIAAGTDAKYPPLPDGSARNPFGFARDPEAELALHRALARRGFVPLHAWRIDGQADWQRPYLVLRRRTAIELGLRR